MSLSENICCAHTSYSLMLLLNGYLWYADYIKKAVFNAFLHNFGT